MKTKEKYWLIVNFLLNYVIIILLRFTWHLSGLQSAHLGLCLSYFERLPRLLYIFLKTWTKTETKKNDFISIPPIEVSKSRVHMWIPSLTHTPVAPVSELINQWSRSISGLQFVHSVGRSITQSAPVRRYGVVQLQADSPSPSPVLF